MDRSWAPASGELAWEICRKQLHLFGVEVSAEQLVQLSLQHSFVLTHASVDADEVNGIVIDIGASTVKAGYAGEDTPKAVFPSVCHFHLYLNLSVYLTEKDASTKRLCRK